MADNTNNMNAEENKEKSANFFSDFARAYIGSKAESGHSVYAALQKNVYPEDYAKREDRKNKIADLELEALQLRNQNLQQNLQHQKDMRTTSLIQNHEKWDNWAKNGRTEIIENLKDKIGYNNLNYSAQNIVNNSTALQEFADIAQILRAYDISSDLGDYMLGKTGYTRKDTSNGYEIISSDGAKTFDSTKLKEISKAVQDRLRADYMAAYTLGEDAQSLYAVDVKGVLSDPATKSAYSSPGDAVIHYKNILNRKYKDAKGKIHPFYSDEDKTRHLLVRAINSFVAGGISEAEKQYLAPQFATALKKMGGEVIYNEKDKNASYTPENILIRFQDGKEMNLKAYADMLSFDDRIGQDWKLQVQNQIASNAEQKRKREIEDIKLLNMKKKNGINDTEAAGEVKGTAKATIPQAYIDAYNSNYTLLDKEQKAKLNDVYNAFKNENKTRIENLPKKFTTKDLEVLKQLDRSWNKIIDNFDLDAKKIPSPYHKYIQELKANVPKTGAFTLSERLPLLLTLAEGTMALAESDRKGKRKIKDIKKAKEEAEKN
jgi:hypothetical protein